MPLKSDLLNRSNEKNSSFIHAFLFVALPRTIFSERAASIGGHHQIKQ
jgi:hypothetical protein